MLNREKKARKLKELVLTCEYLAFTQARKCCFLSTNSLFVSLNLSTHITVSSRKKGNGRTCGYSDFFQWSFESISSEMKYKIHSKNKILIVI